MKKLANHLKLYLCGPVLLISAACSSLPEVVDKQESHALQTYQNTELGKFFSPFEVRNPGKSGFIPVFKGRIAFADRVLMTELAEKTIDAQYYIWEKDATGRLLIDRMLVAADRGVRVRLLVDDINLKGKDPVVAALDVHPNIEVRVFNPFAHRDRRAVDFMVDLERVNHRMHNKLLAVDNSLAIIGGRNIGNHYFASDESSNFRDLDVVAAGPIVRELSSSFDLFWNSSAAYPASAIVKQEQTAETLVKYRTQLAEYMAQDNYPYPLRADVSAHGDQKDELLGKLVWAPAEVLSDPPDSIQKGSNSRSMRERLFTELRGSQREILIESAYLVTTQAAVDVARELRARDVRVRILTNSLVSNDVVAAHAGWAKRRDQLIKAGVEVYELRPDSGYLKKDWASELGSSRAALHSKVLVLDRERSFIGSYNLDPRSAYINTEIAVLINSEELAEMVAEFMDEGVLPDNVYRVELVDGKLLWTATIDGEEVLYHKEPLSTLRDRNAVRAVNMLPLESQL
jgi:putative cardiolipin synthase